MRKLLQWVDKRGQSDFVFDSQWRLCPSLPALLKFLIQCTEHLLWPFLHHANQDQATFFWIAVPFFANVGLEGRVSSNEEGEESKENCIKGDWQGEKEIDAQVMEE